MDHTDSTNTSTCAPTGTGGTTGRLGVEELMAAFISGWRAPHAHAWDHLLAEDVDLVQPLLPDRRGRHALAEEYGRLLELLPDLRGEVERWTRHEGPDGTRIVIDMQLRARVGHRELLLPVTDTLTLDDTGRIHARLSTASSWSSLVARGTVRLSV